MSDKETVVHIGENSPEHVALVMARFVLTSIEDKSYSRISREEFLDTYAECLDAVRGRRTVKG